MNLKAKQLMVLAVISLFFAPLVFAAQKSATWTTWTTEANTTNNNMTQTTIGHGYTKTLQEFKFTNSSTSNCSNIKWLLEYDGTNTSWYEKANATLSTLSAKVVKPYFNTTAVGGSCIATTPTLTYTPTGAIDADVVEALPTMGSDTGSFLKNLGPGIGAFIIILGVFSAIAAIVYAIVGVVKNKVTV